jgi:hypothetical protein
MVLHHWTGPVRAESHHYFTHVGDNIKPPTVVSVGFEPAVHYFSAFKLFQLFLAFFYLILTFYMYPDLFDFS